MTIIYMFIAIKLFITVYFDLSYETRIVLSDITVYMGGVRKYTNYAIFAAIFSALYFQKLFHFTTDRKLFVWIELFDMIRGLIPPKQLNPNE